MSPNVWKGFKVPPAAFDQSLAALKRNSVTGTKTASCTACQSQPKRAGRRSEPTLPRHRGQGDGRQGTVSKGAELFLITCCSVILSLALCNCMWVVSILHPSFPLTRLLSQRMWSDLFSNRVGTGFNKRVRQPCQAGLESPHFSKWCMPTEIRFLTALNSSNW